MITEGRQIVEGMCIMYMLHNAPEITNFDFKKYGTEPNGYQVKNDNAFLYWVGRGGLTMHSMFENGASREEMIDIVKFCLVAVNAQKYRLDVKKAAEEFNFRELERKYKFNY